MRRCPRAQQVHIPTHTEEEERKREGYPDNELRLLVSEFLGTSCVFFVCIDNVKTEIPDFIDDGFLAERGGIKGNRGIFGSEADLCGKNALHFFQMPRDGTCAVFAVHSGDGEVKLVFHFLSVLRQ